MANSGPEPSNIEQISAVTFCVSDMARSVNYYEKLGFGVIYGGSDAVFTSLQAGQAFVNLIADRNYRNQFWGRAIFRVGSADDQYARVVAAGLHPENPPADAEWGERYFHLRDPDGHELSFAELLPEQTD